MFLQKTIAVLLFVTLTSTSFAQKTSAANTKKLLTSHEWELKYYLDDDKRKEIPERLKGLRLVFMPTKELIYEYLPGDTEPIRIRKGLIEEQHFKYADRIEEPDQTIDIDKLEDEGILSFSDEYDEENVYSVYERVGKIKDKGYPAGKYIVEDLEVPMQRIHPEVEKMTKALASELKKANGNLFFYDKNKDRFLIKEVNLEATEYGLKYSMVYDTKSSTNQSYSYEFMPEHIDEITEVKVAPESRIGQLKITLTNESCFNRNPNNSYTTPVVRKTVSIDFFKETASSFANLKEKLEDLSDAYIMGRTNRLEFLPPYVDKGRKIWLSQDGNSNNYELSAIDIAGGKIYLHYNLEMVGLSSNKKGSYLTIIPLKDITGMAVEMTKSNPSTLILHSKKKGFETYSYNKDKYTISDRVYFVPLFNYGELTWKQKRVASTLIQLIDDEGGDKVKLVYNP